MQEEVTGKAVALIVDGAKMSEQVLEKALQKFLEAQKNKSPKMHRGKQTLKQLAGQNAGLANIEISDRNIKAFTHVAKKYHVDFALKKDTTAEQPRYLVFFKSRDADAITAAFQEFASRKMGREERTSVCERLAQAKEKAAQESEKNSEDSRPLRISLRRKTETFPAQTFFLFSSPKMPASNQNRGRREPGRISRSRRLLTLHRVCDIIASCPAVRCTRTAAGSLDAGM